MKQFGLLAAVAVSACLSFSGCSNDVYNPENITPTQTGSNPLGEGFTAPSNFDWSMMNTVKLNVEVKDEFNGQYNYLIEVFTSNPLTDTSATPIAAGTAKKGVNYTTELNISKAVERLFIRQTDPKQRKEIYEYAVPTDGGTLNCQLYYSGSNSTSSLKTRSASDGGTSGWSNITDPGYTEQTYTLPANNSVISSNQLPNGGAYVIKSGETFNKDIDTYNGANSTVYVQGTWDIPSGASIQGIDIIVLSGGKITSGIGGFMVSDKSSLTIQSGGEVDCNYFNTATDVLIKNFGTFHAKGIRSQYYAGQGFNTGTVLYNAKNATFKVDDSFYITSSTIYNHGTIEVTNATAGLLQTNNDLSCVIANYAEASVKAHAFKGGATVVNNGFIEVDICENTSTDALYNNCTFIVKESFKFRNVVLDKGSITGGRENLTSKVWLPVPYVESQTDSKFTLIDGSMIKATNFVVLSGDVIFNAKNTSDNTSKSMIKVENTLNFTEPTHVQLLGNLVIEAGSITGISQYHQLKKNESVTTGFDESKYTIETCGGLFDDGNEGGNPSNPTVPVVEDATKYTYAFEDNWPAYGDLDLNDLVITIDKKEIKMDDGYVKSAKIDITLQAVGASKTLGLGLRFLKLQASVNPSKSTIEGNNASFESGQSIPTLILFNSARAEFGNASGTEFINTTTTGYTTADCPNYQIRFEFNSSDKVPASAFNINNFDVFIISQAATSKTKRTEIHLPGYAPTDLANTDLFKQANDNSSTGHYYLSTENLAWGIVVPADFAWPLETKKVTDVYSQFKTWITSGGKEDADWYTTHNSNVYTK